MASWLEPLQQDMGFIVMYCNGNCCKVKQQTGSQILWHIWAMENI